MYLAPALLVATAVQIASFESTYPVLSAFKWQQTYLAIAASPISPGQILAGQLSWIAHPPDHLGRGVPAGGRRCSAR